MFRRTVKGRVLEFGVSGLLRFSNLVLYDRQTESWWQQIGNKAVVGELTGETVELLASPLVSWAEFKSANPDALVLSRDTGYRRPYGQNPYRRYDSSESPFLYEGQADNRLPAMERVVALELDREVVAFPFSALADEKVIQATVDGQGIVIFFQEGTASAVDASTLAQGRDVGSTGVFIPEIDGQQLAFAATDGAFTDEQTGTTWNLFGTATAGPLRGKQLEPVVHANHFWFAWAAFKPETRVYRVGEGG